MYSERLNKRTGANYRVQSSRNSAHGS